jgi:hypothetical protein
VQPCEVTVSSIPVDELMQLRPQCNCCRQRLTRIILPSPAWNASGSYLFQCLNSGAIAPIADIEYVIRTGAQEPPRP